MTRIEDMSETERQSWVTLIVDVVVFIIFLRAMTRGVSIESFDPAGLSKLVLGVIIVTVILHIIIQSIFAVRARGQEDNLKDERDTLIERKGSHLGFYVLSILLAILIGHIVIQNGLNAIPEISEKHQSVFDYTNTSHLVFALIFMTFMGDIVKNAVMVLAYRGV